MCVGLFTGTLYPPAQVHAGAFYRQSIGLVGPEPGDWVEAVDKEGNVHNESIENIGQWASRSLEDLIVLGNGNVEPEPEQSSEELSILMDKLHQVQQLLKNSETKRQEAIQDLRESNTRNEEKEISLRAKIKAQEAMNKKAILCSWLATVMC